MTATLRLRYLLPTPAAQKACRHVLNGVSTFELPWSLSVPTALHCLSGEPFLVLLDSAARTRERDARYSFLTADPVLTQVIRDAPSLRDPFERLREWQKLLPAPKVDSLPPFIGGIAGLMSYELGEAFERVPRPGIDDFRTPALLAGLFDWCLVWDHIELTVRACVLRLNDSIDGRDADLRHYERLEWIRGQLANTATNTAKSTTSKAVVIPPPVPALTGHRLPLEGVSDVYSDFSRETYLAAVSRVVDYIRAGDIFQANLSQRLTASWSGSAVELYQRVRRFNPAPFCALLQTDAFAVVSASPERFLRVTRGRHVETRPIKGTRRRQKSPIADLYTSDELTSSAKDRAENVMIVDLLRNDLSRSCRSGSVRVTGLCEIELFETVQHLVSTIVGELRDDKDIWDLCAGSFPGGSITGAPKIRAMQIIAELEPTVRGAYCGSLFFSGPQRDFDSSILIRTFTLKDGCLQFPVGGGIVADSNAEDEYRETLHKASGMLRVLRAAESR